MRKIRKGDTIMVKPTNGGLRPVRVAKVNSQTSLVVVYNKGNKATVTVAQNANKTGKHKLASE